MEDANEREINEIEKGEKPARRSRELWTKTLVGIIVLFFGGNISTLVFAGSFHQPYTGMTIN